MKKSVFKMAVRSIRDLPGRFVALTLMIVLSVGFFSGLKITRDAMVDTADKYLRAQNLHDFRLTSTIGFSESDAEALSAIDSVSMAEGNVELDAYARWDGSEYACRFIGIPKKINLPALVAGRMPENVSECLADSRLFEESEIGKTIQLSGQSDVFPASELTIVGLADSPLYISSDRGSSTLGDGTLAGFFYLPAESFADDVPVTDPYLTVEDPGTLYSEAYDDRIAALKPEVRAAGEDMTNARYAEILAEAGVTPELAAQLGMEEPSLFVLTRAENAGCVSYKSDTAIVSGLANLFPFFFVLVAMLVCITTMTRMVDEERTQMGVLKAMGFSDRAVMAKYLIYAGGATLLGWVFGFFGGTWLIPKVFWLAYGMSYDFAPIRYLFSPALAMGTILVSPAGTLGSTFFSCMRDANSAPAALIRPRAPKPGKRILLERISPLWSRLAFLQKITLRNMCRYKKRMFMMLIGIGGCAALLVTAFGVRDSMLDVGRQQYVELQHYDLEAVLAGENAEDALQALPDLDCVRTGIPVETSRMELHTDAGMQSVQLLRFNQDDLSDFWTLKEGDRTLDFPGQGEALISSQAAEKLDVVAGDTVEIRSTDMETLRVTVAGVFENCLDNYAVVSDETASAAFGTWTPTSLLICAEGDVRAAVDVLRRQADVASVTLMEDARQDIEDSLSALNIIVWLIVAFAGALAFVVIFNLTNINLAERSREIATVEVLGFYPEETDRYVLQENIVLSFLAGLIGLPCGWGFHRLVMGMIVVDGMHFQIRVAPVSYVLALLCTLAFALLVNLFMRRRIAGIQMAESLKSVE